MSKPVVGTLVLASVLIYAYVSIMVLVERNGTAALLSDFSTQPGAPLPGTDLAGRSSFTGNETLDSALSVLVRFFYPCVTGQMPALSIFGGYMLGQLVPLQAALLLESLRTGNKWTAVWFVTLWGLLYQSVSLGVTMPVYFLVHLWSSPLARLRSYATASSRVELLSADPVKVVMVTPAVLLGLVVPSALMSLPAPQYFTVDNQQILTAMWQIFPFWVGLWHFDLVFLFGPFDPVPASANRDPTSRLRHAAWTYRVLLLLAGASHVAVVAFAAFPALIPDVFGLTGADHAGIDLRSVFAPMSVSTAVRVGSIAKGSLALLQWDLYCASAAALAWVVFMAYGNSGASWAVAGRTAGNALLRSVVVGPMGAALWALWDRDEEALHDAAIEGKKNE